MASLSIDNDEIYSRLAMQMGINRDPAEWSQTNRTDAERIIRSGRRKLFSAHDWSFLEVRHDINVIAPADTGTVEVVNGVVTLTGSTFHASAANQHIAIDGAVYQIDTRDSNTQVTLKDTSVNVDALTPYKLYFTRYALPNNFSAIVGPVTIENSQVVAEMAELPVLPEHQVRGSMSKKIAYSARPTAFSVFHTVDEETGIASHFVDMYPLPDNEYLATMRVRILPGDALAEVGDVCGAEYAELLLEAILAACEQLYNDAPGLHTELFEKMLPDFIRKDKVAQGVRRLKNRPEGRRGNYPRNYQLIVAPVDVDAGSF
jgi:hypothetical protein